MEKKEKKEKDVTKKKQMRFKNKQINENEGRNKKENYC